MEIILCAMIGYMLGILNPTALIAKIKKVNVRKRGTGNLGATNAFLNFGRFWGLFVMLFDISKAYAAYRIAESIFTGFYPAGLLAGGAAVAGHIFPFYLRFRGGKGFACFAGLVLAFDLNTFVLLLTLGLFLMMVTDFSLMLQFSAALLFPVMSGIQTGSTAVIAISSAVSFLVILMHRSNIRTALRGEDIRVSEFIRDHLIR